jgi:hypothetical protein
MGKEKSDLSVYIDKIIHFSFYGTGILNPTTIQVRDCAKGIPTV